MTLLQASCGKNYINPYLHLNPYTMRILSPWMRTVTNIYYNFFDRK
jgi:hypothetical protein